MRTTLCVRVRATVCRLALGGQTEGARFQQPGEFGVGLPL